MPHPPRGVFVPTPLIFHPELPAAVLVSWIRLRSLAWTGWETQPMSLAELASQLGIHPRRLERHLAQLQEVCALLIRNAGQEKLVLSFPAEPTPGKIKTSTQPSLASPPAGTPDLPESQAPAAYFPARILGYISYDDEQEPPYFTGQSAAQPSSPLAQLENCLDRQPALLPK